MRATWHTFFADPAFTMRFFISDPGELWMPLIRHENETYGDLIMLPGLEESAQVATTIKQFEFFKYLAEHGSSWDFVSKLDDDSFLDAQSFYRTFLLPRLATLNHDRIIIGRLMTHSDPEYIYAGGQFFTLSWEMVTLVARLYTLNPIKDEIDDVLLGRLLYEANERFEFITLDNQRAFDYEEENDDVSAWSHKVMEGAINPHRLKDDETYLRIAAMYDSNGLKSNYSRALF
jgi:beta-1,3-galactosyltransferase 1